VKHWLEKRGKVPRTKWRVIRASWRWLFTHRQVFDKVVDLKDRREIKKVVAAAALV
jgi:hypothetical protein